MSQVRPTLLYGMEDGDIIFWACYKDLLPSHFLIKGADYVFNKLQIMPELFDRGSLFRADWGLYIRDQPAPQLI